MPHRTRSAALGLFLAAVLAVPAPALAQQLYDFDSSKVPTADGTKDYSGTANVDFTAATINHVDETITVTDDWGTPGDTSDDLTLGTVTAPSTTSKTFNYQRYFTVGDFPDCGTWYVKNTAKFVTNDTLSSDVDWWTVEFQIDCFEGCTPGFWQGGNGINLWDEKTDTLAVAVTAALEGEGMVLSDVFYTEAVFSDIFGGSDNRTLLEIVGIGGGPDFENKAKRDMIAALLNAVDGEVSYPYTVAQILADFNSGDFEAFHAKYAAANELGCDR